uniref:Uncharacterized protein n=1 Tax=Arundo donax TaxID=35708 RepID=A0A0A9FL17_ARUDO
MTIYLVIAMKFRVLLERRSAKLLAVEMIWKPINEGKREKGNKMKQRLDQEEES